MKYIKFKKNLTVCCCKRLIGYQVNRAKTFDIDTQNVCFHLEYSVKYNIDESLRTGFILIGVPRREVEMRVPLREVEMCVPRREVEIHAPLREVEICVPLREVEMRVPPREVEMRVSPRQFSVYYGVAEDLLVLYIIPTDIFRVEPPRGLTMWSISYDLAS